MISELSDRYGLRGEQDALPIVRVDDGAADQAERQGRHEAHQADEAQVERRARQGIHLPGDDRLEHGLADAGADATDRIQAEGGHPQDGRQFALERLHSCDRFYRL